VRWDGATARVTLTHGAAPAATQDLAAPQLVSETLTLAWRFTDTELQCVLVRGVGVPSVLRLPVATAAPTTTTSLAPALRISGAGVDLYRVYVVEAPTPEAVWVVNTTTRDATGAPLPPPNPAGPWVCCIGRR
jgi:hypothetical protein